MQEIQKRQENTHYYQATDVLKGEFSSMHDWVLQSQQNYVIIIIKVPILKKGLKRDEENTMLKVSYKKLWKLLIDLEINKKTLAERAGISASTLTKLTKGECVHMDMLVKICTALECDLSDIVELVSDNLMNESSQNR